MTDKAWTAIEEQVASALHDHTFKRRKLNETEQRLYSFDDLVEETKNIWRGEARAALEASHHQELVETIEALIDKGMTDPFIWKRARAVLALMR